jgi:hypothetical protein
LRNQSGALKYPAVARATAGAPKGLPEPREGLSMWESNGWLVIMGPVEGRDPESALEMARERMGS